MYPRLGDLIFSDHAAGSICDAEMVTDQRLYKPFFDFTNDQASPTTQSYYYGGRLCSNFERLVAPVRSLNQKMDQ